MPLVEKRQHDTYTFVLWEITESLDFFLERVYLTADEKITFEKIGSDKRKKEWIAVRFLLQTELTISSEIKYDENRKPSIPAINIGISHSQYMVSVIVSQYPCAIDIEEITPRVAKIAHRAFSDKEIKQAPTDEQLTTLWCIKETVYKLYGSGEVDFKKDIEIQKIENFTSGLVSCRFLKKNVLLNHLNHETIGTFKLVWIVDNLNICDGF